jgi:hypothetical protein
MNLRHAAAVRPCGLIKAGTLWLHHPQGGRRMGPRKRAIGSLGGERSRRSLVSNCAQLTLAARRQIEPLQTQKTPLNHESARMTPVPSGADPGDASEGPPSLIESRGRTSKALDDPRQRLYGILADSKTGMACECTSRPTRARVSTCP